MLVDDEAIITDVRGRILEVNERAEHLLGYERKNLVHSVSGSYGTEQCV